MSAILTCEGGWNIWKEVVWLRSFSILPSPFIRLLTGPGDNSSCTGSPLICRICCILLEKYKKPRPIATRSSIIATTKKIIKSRRMIELESEEVAMAEAEVVVVVRKELQVLG